LGRLITGLEQCIPQSLGIEVNWHIGDVLRYAPENGPKPHQLVLLSGGMVHFKGLHAAFQVESVRARIEPGAQDDHLPQAFLQPGREHIVDVSLAGYKEADHTRTALFRISASNKGPENAVHPTGDELTRIRVGADALILWFFTFYGARQGNPEGCQARLLFAHGSPFIFRGHARRPCERGQ
jgi:hypothetical protein